MNDLDKLKNGLTGTIVNNVSIVFDTYDVGYSHTVPVEDIVCELNSIPKKKVEDKIKEIQKN